MEQKILVIEPEMCTGCRLCELICSIFKERMYKPDLSRIRVVRMFRAFLDMPLTCLHCEEPLCKDICPVGAISRDDVGAIIIDKNVCVGCKACMIICPYGVISFDSARRIFLKCDLCGGDPLCVKYCPTKAIDFITPEEFVLRKKRAVTSKFARAEKLVQI